MPESFMNRELPLDQQLSGKAYVAAIMKGDGGSELCKIATAVPLLCGHTNRICADCAYQWAWDYELLYPRTAGGRALKAALDAQAAPTGGNTAE